MRSALTVGGGCRRLCGIETNVPVIIQSNHLPLRRIKTKQQQFKGISVVEGDRSFSGPFNVYESEQRSDTATAFRQPQPAEQGGKWKEGPRTIRADGPL